MLTVSGDQDFDFRYDDKGSYSLYINGKLWLQNGPTFFNGYGKTWSTDSTESPLVLKSVTELSGGDANEKWKETQFTYTLGNTKTSVIAAIRIYTASIYTTTKVLFSQVNIYETDSYHMGQYHARIQKVLSEGVQINSENVFFYLIRGREDPNTTKNGGYYWPASETPFKCVLSTSFILYSIAKNVH